MEDGGGVARARERWKRGLFSSLATLRSEGSCTDTSLVTGEGGSCSAHALVLAAVSPVLRLLLGTAGTEGHTLLLPHATREEVEDAVKSIYNGTLSATARHLLDTHGLLQEPKISLIKEPKIKLDLATIKLKEEPEEEEEMQPFDGDMELGEPWEREDSEEEWEDPEDLDYKDNFVDEKPKQEKKKRKKYNQEWEDPEDFDYKDISVDENTKQEKKKRKKYKKRHMYEAEGIEYEPDVLVACKFCDKECSSTTGLQCHQKKCKFNKLGQVQCFFCQTLLDSFSDLAPHMKSEHQDIVKTRKYKIADEDNRTTCKFCSFEFKHLGTHKGVQIMPIGHEKTCLRKILKSLQCSHCPVAAPSKDMLLEHLKSHGLESPPFPCMVPDCEGMSGSKRGMILHMHTKHGIRMEKDSRFKRVWNFTCKFCPVTNQFTSAEECAEHEAQWHGIPCTETDCDFTCESEHALQEHMVKVHDLKIPEELKLKEKPADRSVCCDICGKRYSNPNNLKDHMEIHEDKEVRCDKCDKVFKRSLNLKMHMRSQHSDKTFVCPYCAKVCSNGRNLKGHIAQYHEEKRFHCDICGKGFTQNKKLEEHTVSVHTKTTPHSCKYGCGRAYNDRSNCRQHERSVHEGNPRAPKMDRGNLYEPHSFSP